MTVKLFPSILTVPAVIVKFCPAPFILNAFANVIVPEDLFTVQWPVVGKFPEMFCAPVPSNVETAGPRTDELKATFP